MQSTSKRQIRAGRPAPKPSDPPAAPPRRPVAPRLTPLDLIERIVGLQFRQVPLETFASEALPAALQTFGAIAGALLLYHCEDESLVLVAEQGLSDAGRQHLGALRKGAAEAWEIPLHGLLNRKAYIIERPQQHPFVPELVPSESGPQVVNLATVPLYRGALPVGILLLISDRRPITEAEILAAVLSLDVLALALEPFLRGRRGRSSPVAVSEPAASEITPASLVCEPWVEPREAASRLESELAAVTRERQALAGRLTELEARLVESEARVTKSEARLTESEARLVESEARVTKSEARLTKSEARPVELEARLVESERALEAERRASVSRDAERTETRDERSAAELTAAETALDRLRATLAERDVQLAEGARAHAALAAERDQAQQAARMAGDIGQKLRDEAAAQAREIERLHATHTEALARATAHAGDAHTLAAELTSAQAQAAGLREDRERLLAAIGDPGADPAAVIRALREQVANADRQRVAIAAERAAFAEERAALADMTAQRDDLEARLQWALTEREEAAAAASARERRAVECLEAERRATAAERESVHERLAGVERGGAEQAARIVALEQELSARDETIVAATHQRAALDGELATLRAELTRLREDRERVLAVVDEPGVEPAAVIKALREKAAALEAEIATFATERAEQARRAATAADEAEHRLGVERRKVAEARGAHRAELESLQASHRTEVEQYEAARRVQVEELEAAGRRALERNEAAHQHALEEMHAGIARLEEEHRATCAQLETDRDAACTMVDALRVELAAQNASPAARDGTRAPSGATSGEGAEATARFKALEGELVWRGETQAAAERRAEELEHELARVRAESGRLREEHARGLADAEARHQHTLVGVRAAHERALAVVAIRTAGVGEAPGADGLGAMAVEGEIPQAMEVRQVAGHRILEPDAARRAAIFDVLATSLPAAPGKTFMVVNLLTALPEGAADLAAAVSAGVTVVGYAADAHGQSRIIGALRCFAEPPTAEEAVAALESTHPQGPRRVLTLSDDIDAFLPAKAGLSKAGHSVSMACDAKQAADLLLMLRPDAVLVDFRTAPHAAAELMAALTLEQGNVLVLIVHGDPARDALAQVMRRLLRPASLDPSDLVRVCRATLTGPASVARSPHAKPIMFERAKPPPRKPAPRRLMTRRR